MLPSRKITPKPATTVVEETTPSQVPDVGTSNDYARADHTHGTPPDSGGTPATTVEPETAFGISPAVGTDTEYARQDHTHGTPENPVPDHEAALDPHPQYFIDNVSAASRLIGRGSGAGAGVLQEIILGSGLSMSGTTLNATGGGGAANGYFPAGW